MIALPLSGPSAPPLPRSVEGLFRTFGFTRAQDLHSLARWSLAGVTGDESEQLARARALIESWCHTTLSTGFSRGRAAFVLCGIAERFGAAVITGELTLSAEELAALRAAVPCATPEETPSAMAEQQLERNPLRLLLRRAQRPAIVP